MAFAWKTNTKARATCRLPFCGASSTNPITNCLGRSKTGVARRASFSRTATWWRSGGDVQRVDMTFSVTKSYLSTVAGLAVDAGLIRDVQDSVAHYVWDGTFDGKHNAQITWDHLLTQSSDWSGQLFGGYDWADRPPETGGIDEWRNRPLHPPGTHFEYNDVRVNVLAYSLLQVWRQPLPRVLREKIMDPIGASTTWRWYGYDNSFVNVDGLRMQSVSGGGHSGGGLFINTLDHARFGLLFLRQGRWDGRQLLSEDWIERVRQPSAANESYGYLWWLNRGERAWEEVDESIYYAAGFGGNFIVIDEAHDLVIVTPLAQSAADRRDGAAGGGGVGIGICLIGAAQMTRPWQTLFFLLNCCCQH